MQYKPFYKNPAWLLAVGLVSLLGVVPASGQQPIPVIVKAVGVRSLRRPRGGPRNIAGQ
jgi:hypothetical protein